MNGELCAAKGEGVTLGLKQGTGEERFQDVPARHLERPPRRGLRRSRLRGGGAGAARIDNGSKTISEKLLPGGPPWVLSLSLFCMSVYFPLKVGPTVLSQIVATRGGYDHMCGALL